ncbi:MAG TPA: hypothetical protein DHW49_01835 [Anaerolineae bacterium]|nr:hypothetical protein [Anaerolineae bacterium]
MESLGSKLPDNTIEYIGIGSLHFLGAFMIIDKFTVWYGWVEVMSRAPIWTVVVAVPAIFFSYIIGFISIIISDFIFSLLGFRKKDSDITEFLKIALSNNYAIFQNYQETNKSRRILSGVSLGFLTISLGIFFQLSRPSPADNINLAFQVMGFGFILLTIICISLAISLTKRNKLLVNKFDEVLKPEKQKPNKK